MFNIIQNLSFLRNAEEPFKELSLDVILSRENSVIGKILALVNFQQNKKKKN